MCSVPSSRSPEPYAPWLDLPIPLTELILERLPLPDYIRLAAVCKRWQSIQQQHRLRYAPNPPPMLPLPWLAAPALKDDGSMVCYSVFEQRTYCLPLPMLEGGHYRLCRPFSNGLLLLFHRDMKTFVFIAVNPVSKAQIQLPPLTIEVGLDYHCIAAMSSPSSTDFALLINAYDGFYLCRSGDLGWTKWAVSGKPLIVLDCVVVCEGKFYCLFSGEKFFVVNPYPQPTMEIVEMDGQQLHITSACRWNLTECCGDLLVVEAVEIGDGLDSSSFVFQVSRADLLGRKWTRVENIGDKMLLFHDFCCASVLANDVGGKGNCIYFNNGLLGRWSERYMASWSLFDLGTGRISHMALPSTKLKTEPWQWTRMTWMFMSIC